MSIGQVQARIDQIRSMMLLASRAPVTTATTASAATPTASARTDGSSSSQFAAALNAALANGAAQSGLAAARGGAPSTSADGWARPTTGQVSSGFGPRWGTQHEGLDIAAGTGTPVRAATDGVVKKASWYGGYGNAVVIDHGGGLKTLYGHNSKLLVKPGDRVQAGQIIAKVGSTGDSTGPHLHFEVEVDGTKIDPRPWLAKRGITY